MNALQYWIGVDVSKLKLDVAVLDVRGKIKQKVFENNPAGFLKLRQWLSERGVTPSIGEVCMEATGPYSEASATALVEAGWTVAVVNPARVKGFSQSQMVRNKTDRSDATLLARFCSVVQPEPWQPPKPEVRQLRLLVDRLQVIKDMQQQERNRLEAHADDGVVRSSIQKHVEWLEERAKELQKQINDHIDGDKGLKADAALLASIPGLGEVTTPKVLALLGDVRRFKNAKSLAAFVGVTPRVQESGSSVRGRSTMSRAGHADIRTALYMPALVAARHNPLVKAFGDRLREGGMAPKAVIGACMHKLVLLMYGVLRSGKPFDPEFGLAGVDSQDGI